MGFFDKPEPKPERFVKKCSQMYTGSFYQTDISVVVDSVTGVNYILCTDSGASNMTPLIGADGKIVVDELPIVAEKE